MATLYLKQEEWSIQLAQSGDDNELDQMALAIVFEPSFPLKRRIRIGIHQSW